MATTEYETAAAGFQFAISALHDTKDFCKKVTQPRERMRLAAYARDVEAYARALNDELLIEK